MTNPLSRLSAGALEAVAVAVRTGRLQPPFGATALGRFASQGDAEPLAQELGRMVEDGMALRHIACLLEQVAQTRRTVGEERKSLELVWTGPEVQGAESRDTAVVVRELFASAERSVLVACYAVYQGRQVFKPLADRMGEVPGLRVQMFLNIPSLPSGASRATDAEVVDRYVADFVGNQWPGGLRLPELYYDPRSLAGGGGPRASLHAKCVIVDDERAFVTSANFTEAAHERNIEAGVLVVDTGFALALRRQFETLVTRGVLRASISASAPR